MRKKTIKSYFFKNLKNSPAVNATFCFSKRAIKQRRILARTLTKQVKHPIHHRYNFLIDAYINSNFWHRNKYKLPYYVIKSYYTSDKVIKNFCYYFTPKLRKLYLWYLFKRRFNKITQVEIKNFPNTGVLSSHFVHFISKKNITYQTRSKYKSKQFNTSWSRLYVKIYTHILYNYLSSINSQLYFFTKTLDKRYLYTDEEFTINTSNWYTGISTLKQNKFSKYVQTTVLNTPINIVDYNIDSFIKINRLLPKTNIYFNELDVEKRETLYKDIIDLSSDMNISILFTSSQLLFLKSDDQYLQELLLAKLFYYICIYKS